MVGGPPIEPHAFPASNQGRLSTQVGLWRVREFREMVIVKMCKVRGSTLPVVSHYISENNMQEKKGHHARLTHALLNVRIHFFLISSRPIVNDGRPNLETHNCMQQSSNAFVTTTCIFQPASFETCDLPHNVPPHLRAFSPSSSSLPGGAWTRIHGGLGDAASRLHVSSWPAQGDAAKILDATPTVPRP